MASTSRRTPLLLAAAALLLAAGAAILAEAQTPATQTCASKLVPCASYINSTNPPASCCNSIKEAVDNDLACLCNLYNTPGLLASFGINVTQALQLTRECGVSTNTGLCNVTATPPSSSTPPPATPGGDSDAGRIAWSGVSSLFLILASMMFY